MILCSDENGYRQWEILDKSLSKAKEKLVEIEEVEESAWGKFKSKMDNLVNDIDEDIRKALTYFG